ncbi:hypothetical protein QU593_09985 [Rossellomorea marisflavi]|uniref:hypothetical protein n=1 Tax=Rossellomorea marisflavi TaxID=189381 RepID=UPI0025B06260|nr:hypothetical protein [Rossellomorea marisflavi]WJV20733.1 hypothetical protein QU593_09985 [Rossellomorea marisflavi]
MEYNYELFNERSHNPFTGYYQVSCRVYKSDETQVEVFDLIYTKEEGYEAWTGDIITPKPWRMKITRELNKQSSLKAI